MSVERIVLDDAQAAAAEPSGELVDKSIHGENQCFRVRHRRGQVELSAVARRRHERCSRIGALSQRTVERGRIDAYQRANGIWKQMLGEYQQPPIDSAIHDALKDYVARRKREIEGGSGNGS